MSESLSYTLRMPSDLKGFIDAEAKKRNISSAKFVIDACWSELEEPDDSPFDRPTIRGEAYGPTDHVDPSFKAVVNDVPANLAALRSIPGVFRASDIGTSKQDEARASMPSSAAVAAFVETRARCTYREPDRDTGNVYACGLHQGHKGAHRMGEKVGEVWD